ncbi:MAG: hypothetical protein U9Q82_03170 [Chloroflexota bacterium]|nr:hypothetical protein [Chloroflexota bacterium]
MNATATQRVEEIFSSLGREEKVTIISHGVALRLTELHKRIDMAESRIHQLEEKYGQTLEQLESDTLPNDADYEMYEDYVMWHHWVKTVEDLRERIISLGEIAQQGLYLGESFSAGR